MQCVLCPKALPENIGRPRERSARPRELQHLTSPSQDSSGCYNALCTFVVEPGEGLSDAVRAVELKYDPASQSL
jgi:hypothetical protein